MIWVITAVGVGCMSVGVLVGVLLTVFTMQVDVEAVDIPPWCMCPPEVKAQLRERRW